jgi:hypothetical protein
VAPKAVPMTAPRKAPPVEGLVLERMPATRVPMVVPAMLVAPAMPTLPKEQARSSGSQSRTLAKTTAALIPATEPNAPPPDSTQNAFAPVVV